MAGILVEPSEKHRMSNTIILLLCSIAGTSADRVEQHTDYLAAVRPLSFELLQAKPASLREQTLMKDCGEFGDIGAEENAWNSTLRPNAHQEHRLSGPPYVRNSG